MNFRHTAGSAVNSGRSLLPANPLLAGTMAGGILVGTLFASTGLAAPDTADRHVVKAPAAPLQIAAADKKTGSETASTPEGRKTATRSGAPADPRKKPDLIPAARSLANAPSGDWTLCRNAAAAIEARASTPEHLLSAVTLTETGRRGPEGKSLQAWPWTINAGGKGYVFTTREEALRAVRRLLAQGQRSVDIGCMQVNLKYHPRAFTSLEEAFDPVANLAYGAEFLGRLKKQHGSWDLAVQHYHSYTEEHRRRYAARFNRLWALERKRMARATSPEKTAKAARRLAREKGILARLPDMPRTLVHRVLPDMASLRRLTPLTSLMAVNIPALQKSAAEGNRFLQRLSESPPAIADTRTRSAALAGPVPVN